MKALDAVTAADLSPFVGSAFTLSPPGKAAVTATLLSVVESGAEAPEGRRRPFSAIWRAPAGWLHPQQIFLVTHQALGSLEVFLVPIGPDAAGMRYEAVFN